MVYYYGCVLFSVSTFSATKRKARMFFRTLSPVAVCFCPEGFDTSTNKAYTASSATSPPPNMKEEPRTSKHYLSQLFVDRSPPIKNSPTFSSKPFTFRVIQEIPRLDPNLVTSKAALGWPYYSSASSTTPSLPYFPSPSSSLISSFFFSSWQKTTSKATPSLLHERQHRLRDHSRRVEYTPTILHTPCDRDGPAPKDGTRWLRGQDQRQHLYCGRKDLRNAFWGVTVLACSTAAQSTKNIMTIYLSISITLSTLP